MGSAACDYGSVTHLGDAGTAAATNAGGRGNDASAMSMLTLKQPIDRGDGKLVLEFGSTYFA
ncbi:MAG TPA: hypothetical protein VEQ59_09565, partial [Polyangiaceae bacterium]|nr:hypothetical protein [Polyangiaceae bacterium]